ncbi:unnamed protein product [Phytophthora fragariaefolia]|uniref:Unnamed protein product n=1 Tax=Phytophthora fragariaefolia TaxID=1490495 RepID=A0A9W6XL47_9STRA|nr:unnamed protein product [Phytophthora fragariaefolia]
MKDEPKWIEFLDPRIAGQMSHLNNVEKQQAIKDLISAAAKLSGERIPTQQAASSTTSPPDDDLFTWKEAPQIYGNVSHQQVPDGGEEISNRD